MKTVHFLRSYNWFLLLFFALRNHRVLLEPARQCTRFISLAEVGNPDKKKWLYAFTLTPAIHCINAELAMQPQDVTECPYSRDQLPPNDQVLDNILRYFLLHIIF